MLKLLLFIFSLTSGLFANDLPIQLSNDWYAKEGIHKQFSEDGSWQNFKELTVKSTDFKNLSDSEVIELSFYKSFIVPNLELAESTSLRFPYLANVYEVYFNGNLLAQNGILKDGKMIQHGFTRNVIVKIPPLMLKQKNEILVIVKGMKGDEVALYGDKDTALDFHSNNLNKISERVTLMLLFMYAFVGFYHLLLFVKRPQELYNFFFAMFCLAISLYLYTRSTAVYELDLSRFFVMKIEYIIVFTITSFAVAFFENFFKGKNTIFSKISFGIVALLSLIVVVVDRGTAFKALLAWQLFTLVSFIYMIYLMVSAMIKKHQDSKRLFLGFLFLIVFGVWDIVGAMGLSKHIKNYAMIQYGFFIFIMGIAFVLANRFLRVHKEVEELNDSLERKVEERTRELQKTLTEVNELKLQQDGDYFLTTLLIQPLMVNKAVSKKIKIDFYIKQKKNFQFKNKTYEIGGDMCIANNIQLRGKNYCVFINGDAMGKSIQGAGGALVLGVVFRSIIERSKIFKPNMELFPEQWIKICFIELQNVFVSFDGSMLVSIVMGLVEENTGAMYFLNAEHPWTVLYRDNKASFLENQLYLHKVGMLGLDGNLRVNVIQMQVDDAILIGSDGRDDIMLGMDVDGQRNINEDGDRFLKHVEEGKGELEGITKSILKLGEFTDDYTLIKIQYQDAELNERIIPSAYSDYFSKGEVALHEKHPIDALQEFKKAFAIYKSKEVYKKISEIYYSEKNYEEFLKVSSDYLSEFPTDNEEYFKISYAYKLQGEFSIASDYGECLKLRDPFHINNLLNLADVYRKMKNETRAKKLLSNVLSLEPENAKAKELQAMFG